MRPDEAVEVTLLDGLQNIMPYGIALFMQNQFSTLLDGYKKCELIKECRSWPFPAGINSCR